MNLQQNIDDPFLRKIIGIIENNLENDQFGVSMLARETGMSRSNLHRKVRALTGKSISRLISETRLEHAMKLLRESGYTVSEVAFMVGFGSATYFTKCFHEYFGYPPGEVGKGGSAGIEYEESEPNNSRQIQHKRKLPVPWIITAAVIAVAAILVITFRHSPGIGSKEDHVIAVLPFHNDSPDRENDYILNGLMEEILNKLSHVDELCVISRTTSESYRNSDKSIREIGRELQARYILEGSATILNSNTRIRLQLIEAETNRHLWSKPFEREITLENLFEVQEEVALAITYELRVILNRTEREYVETTPTDNHNAYKFFLQAQELINFASLEGAVSTDPKMMKAKQLLENAIQLDSTFAAAYTWLGHLYIDFFYFAETYRGRYFASACLDSGMQYLEKAHSCYEEIRGRKRPRDENYYFTLRTKANYLKRQGFHESADSVFQEAMKGYDTDSYLMYYSSLDWYISYNNFYTTVENYLQYIDKKPVEIIVPAWIHRIMYYTFLNAGFPELAREHSEKLLSLDENTLDHFERMDELERAYGNYAEGIQWTLKLHESNPLDPSYFFELIWNYLCMEELDQADRITRQIIERPSSEGINIGIKWIIGYVLMQQGKEEQAFLPTNADLESLNRSLENSIETRQLGYILLYTARVYSILGNKEKTLEYLSGLKDIPFIEIGFISELKNFPSYDLVRETSEFQEIMRVIQARYQREHDKISDLLRNYNMIEN